MSFLRRGESNYLQDFCLPTGRQALTRNLLQLMNLKESFQKLMDNGNLSHGYIFFGDPQLDLIKKIAVIDLLDFLLIEPIGGTIGIDVMRGINEFLWRTPLKSTRNTLIINHAEALTLPAQNAILKITEEPPAHSLIFLLVNDYNALIDPLASRFQKIFCTSKKPAMNTSVAAAEAQRFLQGSIANKRAIIKSVANADNYSLENFIRLIMLELDKDPIKNFAPLKELNYRWHLISRYNTNKKLQLEAWIRSFVGY